VVEFGPVAEGMHAANERVRVADLGPLSVIYEQALEGLLASS
jgi:succinyl-diaminopimelate desuccinylase